MPMSEARKRANKKWNDANMATRYDRIQLLVPKGRKKTIEEYVKQIGATSVNGAINAILMERVGMTEEEWKKLSSD